MLRCTETDGAITFAVRAVEIKSGRASKTKLVRVAGATRERLLSLVSAK